MEFFSLWDEAASDLEAEKRDRAFHTAGVASAGVWTFLAAAKSQPEFETRLALAETNLSTVAAESGLSVEDITDIMRRRYALLVEASDNPFAKDDDDEDGDDDGDDSGSDGDDSDDDGDDSSSDDSDDSSDDDDSDSDGDDSDGDDDSDDSGSDDSDEDADGGNPFAKSSAKNEGWVDPKAKVYPAGSKVFVPHFMGEEELDGQKGFHAQVISPPGEHGYADRSEEHLMKPLRADGSDDPEGNKFFQHFGSLAVTANMPEGDVDDEAEENGGSHCEDCGAWLDEKGMCPSCTPNSERNEDERADAEDYWGAKRSETGRHGSLLAQINAGINPLSPEFGKEGFAKAITMIPKAIKYLPAAAEGIKAVMPDKKEEEPLPTGAPSAAPSNDQVPHNAPMKDKGKAIVKQILAAEEPGPDEYGGRYRKPESLDVFDGNNSIQHHTPKTVDPDHSPDAGQVHIMDAKRMTNGKHNVMVIDAGGNSQWPTKYDDGSLGFDNPDAIVTPREHIHSAFEHAKQLDNSLGTVNRFSSLKMQILAGVDPLSEEFGKTAGPAAILPLLLRAAPMAAGMMGGKSEGAEDEDGEPEGVLEEGAESSRLPFAEGAKSDSCPRCGDHMSDVVVNGDTLTASCGGCGWSGSKTKKTSARDWNGETTPTEFCNELKKYDDLWNTNGREHDSGCPVHGGPNADEAYSSWKDHVSKQSSKTAAGNACPQCGSDKALVAIPQGPNLNWVCQEPGCGWSGTPGSGKTAGAAADLGATTNTGGIPQQPTGYGGAPTNQATTKPRQQPAGGPGGITGPAGPSGPGGGIAGPGSPGDDNMAGGIENFNPSSNGGDMKASMDDMPGGSAPVSKDAVLVRVARENPDLTEAQVAKVADLIAESSGLNYMPRRSVGDSPWTRSLDGRTVKPNISTKIEDKIKNRVQPQIDKAKKQVRQQVDQQVQKVKTKVTGPGEDSNVPEAGGYDAYSGPYDDAIDLSDYDQTVPIGSGKHRGPGTSNSSGPGRHRAASLEADMPLLLS